MNRRSPLSRCLLVDLIVVVLTLVSASGIGVLAYVGARQDVKGVAVMARSKQPAVLLDHQQAAGVLRDTVAMLGDPWGFLAKPGGNNCDVGAAVKVSCDWVINRQTGHGCDLFGDAPGFDGAGTPVRGTMQPGGCGLEPSPGQWVALPGSTTTPPTTPTPPAVDLTPILQRLAALEADRTALRAELDALKGAPPVLPPDLLLRRLQDINFECVIGRTGPAFLAHGHGCTVTPFAK